MEVEQMAGAVTANEMKDYHLQTVKIRCIGSILESFLASDVMWCIGNLQFAWGIVSMLCLQGRILSRPQADVCSAIQTH